MAVVPRDRSAAIDVASKRSRFSTQRRASHVTDLPIHLPRLRSRGDLHLPRGNRSGLRFELKLLLKDEKSFYYYLFTRAEYETSLARSNYETGKTRYNAIWGPPTGLEIEVNSITMDVPELIGIFRSVQRLLLRPAFMLYVKKSDMWVINIEAESLDGFLGQ